MLFSNQDKCFMRYICLFFVFLLLDIHNLSFIPAITNAQAGNAASELHFKPHRLKALKWASKETLVEFFVLGLVYFSKVLGVCYQAW